MEVEIYRNKTLNTKWHPLLAARLHRHGRFNGSLCYLIIKEIVLAHCAKAIFAKARVLLNHFKESPFCR